MLYISGKVKKLDLISIILIVSSIILSITIIRSYYEEQIRLHKSEAVLYKEALARLKVKIATPRYNFATNYERKDYHDFKFMEMESMRDGPGEQGAKYILSDNNDIELNEKLMERFGFSAVASDHISVNRSLPDVRLKR